MIFDQLSPQTAEDLHPSLEIRRVGHLHGGGVLLAAFLRAERRVGGHSGGIRFQLQFVGLELGGQRALHLVGLLGLRVFEQSEGDFFLGLLDPFPLSEGKFVGCDLGGAPLVHFLGEKLVFFLVFLQRDGVKVF